MRGSRRDDSTAAQCLLDLLEAWSVFVRIIGSDVLSGRDLGPAMLAVWFELLASCFLPCAPQTDNPPCLGLSRARVRVRHGSIGSDVLSVRDLLLPKHSMQQLRALCWHGLTCNLIELRHGTGL